MTCPCDVRVFPPPLSIAAGLAELPRQLAGFPEFREAMLALIPSQPALREWRARGRDDFGVMLLEMWAYVCDVTAFYDKVIADEAYLRTAKRRPSLRRLTGLLGYVPRPAVGSKVQLALLADGVKPVAVPAGAAFRSGAFGSEPPQTFETGAAASIHPSLNQLQVAQPRQTTIGPGSVSSLLLEPRSSIVLSGDVLLIDVSATSGWVRRVAGVSRVSDRDGRTYVEVRLEQAIQLAAATSLGDVRLFKPTRSAQLRTVVDANEAAPLRELSLGFLVGWLVASLRADDDIASAYRLGSALDLPDFGALGQGPSATPRHPRHIAHAFLELAPLVAHVAQLNPATLLTLDAVYGTIKAGHRVVAQLGGEYRPSIVAARDDLEYTVLIPAPFSVGSTQVTPPNVKARFSELSLQPTLNSQGSAWTAADAPNVTVHFGLVEAGRLAGTVRSVLTPADELRLTGIVTPMEPPETSRFLLVDREAHGVEIGGTLDWSSGVVARNAGTTWSPDLAFPVRAYGNVVDATRGETVSFEILGSGDGSVPRQAFTLKKSPLTYLPSPTADNDSGVASTLIVWVDGIQWTERPSFFDEAPDAPIYVVRQNDAGESIVTFGDGVNGARLPTGVDNVMASYRFGAGAATPPAGSIKQLARPLADVRGVVNPIAASGGADAESAEAIRRLAPRSALLLGRAVSILDMEAAAAGVPGVIDAAAEWRWEGTRQRPVVQIWYVGSTGIEETVERRLRAISDPATPIEVTPATPLRPVLAIDVETDERRLPDRVVAAVLAALLDEETGLLANARIGIGRALFRSRIFEAVLAIPGAVGVRSLQWDGVPWTEGPPSGYGKAPGSGNYFDFEAGNLLISGSTHG
jgi:hypothetical protein